MLSDSCSPKPESFQVLKIQFKVCKEYLEELYNSIVVLQKESGGILDVIGLFHRLKQLWTPLTCGNLPFALRKMVEKLPAAKMQ